MLVSVKKNGLLFAFDDAKVEKAVRLENEMDQCDG
jgi:hypothetical protein